MQRGAPEAVPRARTLPTLLALIVPAPALGPLLAPGDDTRFTAPRRCTVANEDQGSRPDSASEAPEPRNPAGGPSRRNEIDDMALGGPKSEWQERTAPAAGDPVSEDELNGLSILGGSSVRGGALPGVSDPVRDGWAGPRERPDPDAAVTGGGPGGRKSPEQLDGAGFGDGGISASGGRAGGARGHAGTSDAGAGSPTGETAGGPGEYRASSRMDLDHPSSDVGDA